MIEAQLEKIKTKAEPDVAGPLAVRMLSFSPFLRSGVLSHGLESELAYADYLRGDFGLQDGDASHNSSKAQTSNCRKGISLFCFFLFFSGLVL